MLDWAFIPGIQAMASDNSRPANTVIVLDFETTGLSDADRAIEIGAVRIEHGRVTDRFQSLMNPGRRVPPFIEAYTGITSAMLRTAPPCNEVMAQFAEFIDGYDLVAHNASFDRRFLIAELTRIKRSCYGEFSCSMLAARRLYQNAPNHKLGTLVAYHQLPHDGTFHRALADAEMTAQLWLKMLSDLEEHYRLQQIPFSFMQQLTRIPRAGIKTFLKNQATV